MILYLLKTIVCSASLFAIYYLLLERETIHNFNRFYLLFSIIFSFTIPAFTISIHTGDNNLNNYILYPTNYIQTNIQQNITSSVENKNILTNVFLVFYALITTYCFLRFIINIFSIVHTSKINEVVYRGNIKFVLIPENITPYSFFNLVFVNRKEFKEGHLEKQILAHELTHVRQKHSIDVLFIQLLLIFAWVNPLLFLFKRVIQLNHEFLADKNVLNKNLNIDSYKDLLLKKITRSNNYILANPFNYVFIKKRIIMMYKKSSIKVVVLKQLALIPVIIGIGFLFITKISAQEVSSSKQTRPNWTKEGVSQELLNEYHKTLSNYETLVDGKTRMNFNISENDQKRLEQIFFQMSYEQQSMQKYIFIPFNSLILPHVVPTEVQLISYKDPRNYGVWIDGKRVNYDDLNNYSNADFSNVSESVLLPNAKDYGEYKFQVNLMTNQYYLDYINKQSSKKEYMLAIHSGIKQK
jgi:bla regulator protein blaR1